jgi:hypothetical protein
MSISRLVYIESVDANSVDGDTVEEHMRSSAKIAEERGFRSLAVARDDAGRVLTPQGFTDDAFHTARDAHVHVAARTLESSCWGLPVGSDYVAQHWPLAQAESKELVRLEEYRWAMLYSGSNAGNARPRAVYGRVMDVRLSPDESTVVWTEWVRVNGSDRYLVFKEAIGGGGRRLVGRLKSALTGENLSISADGRWLLAGRPTEIIDLETGYSTPLGSDVWTACWFPAAGASSILAVSFSLHNSPCEVFNWDLATSKKTLLGGLPRRTDAIEMGPERNIVAEVNAESDAILGGWFGELVVLDETLRSWDPVTTLVAPSGWRRRCRLPKWTTHAPENPSVVVLSDILEARLHESGTERQWDSNEHEFLFQFVASRLRHRMSRLSENPIGAYVILDEVRALCEYATAIDIGFSEAVRDDVVPRLVTLCDSFDWRPEIRSVVSAISTRARNERGPDPSPISD